MEEDPGRLVHKGGADRARYSLVDYNRAGIPLIEIVTEPDMRSPKEARRFLNKLRATLEYLSVFDSEKEGSLRVDANISLQPEGWFDREKKSFKGRNRVEVKNISSYKGVEKALTFEVTRQRNVIRKGQHIEQATRHFVETQGITTAARSKEEEQDYRYFPEPDLCPLRVSSWVERIDLPELPDARRARFIRQYACSPNHARTLTGDLKLADFYETVAAKADPVLSATWVADTLIGELNYRDMGIGSVTPSHIIELVNLVKAKTLTDKNAIEVLRIILDGILQQAACRDPVTGSCPSRPRCNRQRPGPCSNSRGDQGTTTGGCRLRFREEGGVHVPDRTGHEEDQGKGRPGRAQHHAPERPGREETMITGARLTGGTTCT